MNLNYCSLTVDMTDDELRECIHKMHPRCTESKQGFLLTISGFDYDPRELWEIPEAVKFCQRLIDIGFVALLDMCAATSAAKAGFGLLEVLFTAEGSIRTNGRYEIGREDVQRGVKMYEEANVKVAEILAQPCPDAGIREMEQYIGRSPEATDGAHRHKRRR